MGSTRGELLSATVEATSIAAAGLRASSLTLSSDGVDFVVPEPFSAALPKVVQLASETPSHATKPCAWLAAPT